MTETEAVRCVEILLPYFSVAEAVPCSDSRGNHSWAVRTYGHPEHFTSVKSVGRFILDKIMKYEGDADTDRARMDKQDQEQAEKDNAFESDLRD